jgi:SNF2 family DNA or RNA helicase
LWKLIAPIVLRRRKQEIGEDIVAKKKQIIRAPMGVKQYEVYRYHLMGQYLDKNGGPAMMAKLQALRSAAAAPTSELLQELPIAQEHSGTNRFRSDNDYIPKMATALTVIEQRMREAEQSVVFSALHEPLDTLSRRLAEAKVPHDVLDGRVSAARRGRLAADFQKGLVKGAKPVMLAGLKAMGEGNSWPLANNVILLAYDWAWDLFHQGINRCHRLDSIKDVNVWPIICTGSIDRKLEANIDEKGDASEFVIDGRLIGEDVQEVNLRDLLKIAVEEFREATTYPEDTLEQEWPELRDKLAEAWRLCQRGGQQPKPANRPAPLPLPELMARIRQQHKLQPA